MKARLTALFAVACFVSFAAEKKDVSVFAQKRSKAIFEIFTALSEGLCGEKHYNSGLELLEKASAAERGWLSATLAEYHRRMRHEPVDGIELLAVEVLPPRDAKDWLAQHRRADADRKREYAAAKMQAMRKGKEPPEPPTGLAITFPLKKLTVSEANAPAVLELARCLGKLGDVQSSLYCINACGVHSNKKGNYFLLIQSHESLGDVNRIMNEYMQAKVSYQAALGVFGHLKKEAARYGEKTNYSKWEIAVKARLQRKLAEINRLLEIQRFGPEFVAYRDAHTMELKHKNYVRAFELYDEILAKYPNTVFSEAGKAYSVRCLLALSKRRAPRRGEDKNLAKLEKQLEEDEAFVRLAKRCKVPKPEIQRLENELLKLKDRIETVKAIPYEKEALKRAQDIVRSALRDQRFGLYRSEMLCLLGDHFLEHLLDHEKAYEYYGEAWKWLTEIKANRLAMGKFQVPSKAVDVSKPPKTEKKTEGWTGWIVKNEVTPGQIVNRMTASWYLDSLRARSGKMLSLCFFIREENEKALNAAKAVIAYEPLERKMYTDKRPNSYERLVRAYELGWFRCLPYELKLFRSKTRTAAVLGDFYYEVEDFEKCTNIRYNLTQGVYGKLNKNQMASALYRLAEVYFITDRDEECRKLLEQIASDYKTCFSAADALIGLANIYAADTQGKGSRAHLRKAADLYEAAVKVAKEPTREKAYFYHANALLYLGETERAERLFFKIVQKYPEGRFGAISQTNIDRIKQANTED